MPPRRARKKIPKESSVDVDIGTTIPSDANDYSTSPNAATPRLASIPPEVFDEIIAYYPVLPLNWHYDTTPAGFPDTMYLERYTVLRALAGTCKALRAVTLPRLWSRLDACLVPQHARTTWYKYVMQELKRKTDGVATLDLSVRSYVHIVTLTLSKSDAKATIPYIPKLLAAFPALHTVKVLNYAVSGDFKGSMVGLSLPSVRMLVIPTAANALVGACPNVRHVRCTGGDGSALVGALKGSKCEVLDGMIDWVKDLKLVQRLVKNAPHLNTLEIRRPVKLALDNRTQNTAPADWARVIPALAGLKQLRVLTLTFPKGDEEPSDVLSIKAARVVLRESALSGVKRLVIRRVEAQHHDNATPHTGDLLLSESVELFT